MEKRDPRVSTMLEMLGTDDLRVIRAALQRAADWSEPVDNAGESVAFVRNEKRLIARFRQLETTLTSIIKMKLKVGRK